MILIQICVLLKERGSEENSCHYMESDSNQVVLSNLRRATQYEVQVRARTFAGYGSFGQAVVFRTLPDGKERSSPKAVCCAHLLAPMFVRPQSFVCEGVLLISFSFLCGSKPIFLDCIGPFGLFFKIISFHT